MLLLGACALAAFSLVGLRACWFDSQRLDGALEGRDVQIVGVVRDMTQSSPLGLRFRLQVESALLNGTPVAFPARVDVGWYTGLSPQGAASDLAQWELQRQPQALRPGERWQFTLRVKAPHGSMNPHGFDYELWLWEQGVQATAYVPSQATLGTDDGAYKALYARLVARRAKRDQLKRVALQLRDLGTRSKRKLAQAASSRSAESARRRVAGTPAAPGTGMRCRMQPPSGRRG
jgi:predicted membrane metal-binding protein